MNKKKRSFIGPAFIIYMILGSPLVLAAVSSSAPQVDLKKDCTSTPDDCFTDSGALMEWMMDVRKPDVNTPLVVNVGPGTFSGFDMSCKSDTNGDPTTFTGSFSIKGSGRGVTTFLATSNPWQKGMQFNGGCKKITVQDLTVRAQGVAVEFNGGGSSSWDNVEIIASRAPWYDAANTAGTACAATVKRGEHKIFSSSLILNANDPIVSQNADIVFSSCGNVWIGGSELQANIDVSTPYGGDQGVRGVKSVGQGNLVRIYGTSVRVSSTTDAAATTQYGLVAESGAQVHFHGGEVVVRHENPNNNVSVVAAVADGMGSMVHTIETSYGLLPAGAGVATRSLAVNGGMVMVPFQWPASSTPPTPGDATGQKHLVSVTGQDEYIETDCPATGSCSGGTGGATHVMVYNQACPDYATQSNPGPWFDTTTNACR